MFERVILLLIALSLIAVPIAVVNAGGEIIYWYVPPGYSTPLAIKADETTIKVVSRVDNTTTILYNDIDAGWHNFTNVVEFKMGFGQESTYMLKDDDILVYITNGLVDIEVLVDEGSSGNEEYGPGTVDNYYDSVRVVVDGNTIFYIDDVPISIDFIKLVRGGGTKYFSMTIRYYVAGSWSYKFIVLEYPGLYNVSVYRKGYSVTGYIPCWLPDIEVVVPNTTIIYDYYVNDTLVLSLQDKLPLEWNASDGIVYAGHYNLTYIPSISEIWCNQPIIVNDSIAGDDDREVDVDVEIEKCERIDGKYHYVVTIYFPYDAELHVLVKSTGKIRIEGFGEYNYSAELVLRHINYSSTRLGIADIMLPIAYAQDPGLQLKIVSDSVVNMTLEKIVLGAQEYILNKTITLHTVNESTKEHTYQPLTSSNKVALAIAGFFIFIIIIIVLLGGKGRRVRK